MPNLEKKSKIATNNNPLPPPLIQIQDKDVSFLQLQEMQGRKSRFKEELAQSMRSASELRINFDNHIAQASLDASDMKAAYEQGALVASDDAADMRRTSIEV